LEVFTAFFDLMLGENCEQFRKAKLPKEFLRMLGTFSNEGYMNIFPDILDQCNRLAIWDKNHGVTRSVYSSEVIDMFLNRFYSFFEYYNPFWKTEFNKPDEDNKVILIKMNSRLEVLCEKNVQKNAKLFERLAILCGYSFAGFPLPRTIRSIVPVLKNALAYIFTLSEEDSDEKFDPFVRILRSLRGILLCPENVPLVLEEYLSAIFIRLLKHPNRMVSQSACSALCLCAQYFSQTYIDEITSIHFLHYFPNFDELYNLFDGKDTLRSVYADPFCCDLFTNLFLFSLGRNQVYHFLVRFEFVKKFLLPCMRWLLVLSRNVINLWDSKKLDCFPVCLVPVLKILMNIVFIFHTDEVSMSDSDLRATEDVVLDDLLELLKLRMELLSMKESNWFEKDDELLSLVVKFIQLLIRFNVSVSQDTKGEAKGNRCYLHYLNERGISRLLFYLFKKASPSSSPMPSFFVKLNLKEMCCLCLLNLHVGMEFTEKYDDSISNDPIYDPYFQYELMKGPLKLSQLQELIAFAKKMREIKNEVWLSECNMEFIETSAYVSIQSVDLFSKNDSLFISLNNSLNLNKNESSSSSTSSNVILLPWDVPEKYAAKKFENWQAEGIVQHLRDNRKIREVCLGNGYFYMWRWYCCFIF
jgi:hypothetical protein